MSSAPGGRAGAHGGGLGTDEHTLHAHDDWRRGAVARPAGAAARGRPRPARAGAVAALGGVAAVVMQVRPLAHCESRAALLRSIPASDRSEVTMDGKQYDVACRVCHEGRL